jgi:hypothetical protein
MTLDCPSDFMRKDQPRAILTVASILDTLGESNEPNQYFQPSTSQEHLDIN